MFRFGAASTVCTLSSGVPGKCSRNLPPNRALKAHLSLVLQTALWVEAHPKPGGWTRKSTRIFTGRRFNVAYALP